METKESLPNSIAVLVLGICSLLFGCFFVGAVLGIIGIVLSGTGMQMYRANPSKYTGYGALNAGRIMSIIGVIFGGLYLIYWVAVVYIFGGAAFSMLNLIGK